MRRLAASAAEAATTTPASTSPCPPMYLLAECITKSAPNAVGRKIQEGRKSSRSGPACCGGGGVDQRGCIGDAPEGVGDDLEEEKGATGLGERGEVAHVAPADSHAVISEFQ